MITGGFGVQRAGQQREREVRHLIRIDVGQRRSAFTRHAGSLDIPGVVQPAGIIDPVKVTRNAVSNAVSIAALLLTTESLVVEKPAEPEPASAGGHSHGGHGHQHGPGF